MAETVQGSDASDRSTPELVKQLADQTTALVR